MPPAVELIFKQMNDVDQQMEPIERLLQQEEEATQRLRAAKASEPRTWQKGLREFLSIDGKYDREILASTTRSSELREQIQQLFGFLGPSAHLRHLERELDAARRLRDASEAKARSVARCRALQEKRKQTSAAFAEKSRSVTPDRYGRELFRIRKKDYKRGNPLDNHFRKALLGEVFGAFRSRCLVCHSARDLTLDHFVIPVNEGGNFVLLLADGTGIRMNLVLLCRSCNSSKGESHYGQFFSPEQLHDAEVYQSCLLEAVLGNEEAMGVIRSWYELRV